MLPEHSPFTSEQRNAIQGLIANLSPTQRFWLAGYLSSPIAGAGTPAKSAGGGTKLTILYGTESGNSEQLADDAGKVAKKKGFKVTIKNMADITPMDLLKTENLLVVVSTWGEGDPPESAAPFHKQLMTEKLELPKLRYSVCALGDTSYTQFCQTGKDVDARLAEFGGECVFPRQDCDVDYEEAFREWLDGALEAFGPATSESVEVVGGFDAFVGGGSAYGKKNPFSAELTERVLLNGKGSAKETWHYELSLEGSGMTYQPGDSLAVVPINAPDLVEGILKAAKLSGTEIVEVKDAGKKPLADALREDYDITVLSRPVLEKLQEFTDSSWLTELLQEGAQDKLKDYLWGRWIVDAIKDFTVNDLTAADLVSFLRKLPARSYSIASSPLEHPDAAHLTVASVRYHAHGLNRKGVASTYLADLVKPGDVVSSYIQENKNFRLPEDGDTPVIMVGPGTGIAPFRAFVQHRAALDHKGKSWLFFGDQRFNYDFLYQLEWQDHLKSGTLTKLDVAFSRDQPEKLYVQHRLLERAKEIYAWLEEGASFYVCGDASRMAHDVHEALLTIVGTQGKKNREEAESYLAELKKDKRYQRDVY